MFNEILHVLHVLFPTLPFFDVFFLTVRFLPVRYSLLLLFQDDLLSGDTSSVSGKERRRFQQLERSRKNKAICATFGIV